MSKVKIIQIEVLGLDIIGLGEDSQIYFWDGDWMTSEEVDDTVSVRLAYLGGVRPNDKSKRKLGNS